MWNKLLSVAALILLAGCTINPPGTGETSVIPQAPESLEEKIAKQRFEVVEEINSVPFAGSLDSWGYFDNKAIWVETRPSRYYMLTLQFPCPDLSFTQSIAIKTRLPQIYKNDEVVIPKRATANCRIDRIFALKRIRKSDREEEQEQTEGESR